MKKVLIIFVSIYLSIYLSSCEKVENPYYKYFDSGVLLECEDGVLYPILENDSTIHFQVSKNVNLENIKVIANFDKDTITYLNYNKFLFYIDSDFSDFVNPPIITFELPTKTQIDKKIIIYDLPVLVISTPDSQPILSRDERVKGCVVDLIHDNTVINIGTAGIKVRGNSTASLQKKPYNVKLDKKQSILGMENSKHYTLLANAYYDRTQLHNATAFEIARYTDFPYVQQGEFVEVILNGNHKGLYYLCEKPRVSKGRINISEMSDEDTTHNSITGGYLLESDIYPVVYDYPKGDFSTNFFNKTGEGFLFDITWNIESPEDPNLKQREYIIDCLNYMESLIFDIDSLDNGVYRKYFDIETAINWYLVEELTLNEEASRTKNVFLYKDRGDDKFYVGPPWDFDAWTFGVYGAGKLFCNKTTLYFRNLFKDKYFTNRLKEKWNIYKPIWEEFIPQFITSEYNKIYKSALRNDVMWPDWYQYYDPKLKSYEDVVNEMLKAFNEQLMYMDREINKL